MLDILLDQCWKSRLIVVVVIIIIIVVVVVVAIIIHLFSRWSWIDRWNEVKTEWRKRNEAMKSFRLVLMSSPELEEAARMSHQRWMPANCRRPSWRHCMNYSTVWQLFLLLTRISWWKKITHFLIYSFTYSFIYSFTHLLIHSLPHLLIYLFIHLLIYSFTHLLIYSFTHLLIYLFIHLLIYLQLNNKNLTEWFFSLTDKFS